MNNFKCLEKIDGVWVYKGRRLQVFQNVFFLKNSQTKLSKADWARWYEIPEEAVDEALACVAAFPDEYVKWVKDHHERERSPFS